MYKRVCRWRNHSDMRYASLVLMLTILATCHYCLTHRSRLSLVSIVCLAVQTCLATLLARLSDHAPQVNATKRQCIETACE